jgi:hypothetical protein
VIFGITVAAEAPCLPPPQPRTLAQLVQPSVLAPEHEDGIYALVQVAPHGLDIRAWTFWAVASPSDGPRSEQRLTVQTAHRISSPQYPSPVLEEPKALWVLRIERPRVTSKVTLFYEYARSGETPNGAPCQNPPFRGSFPPFEATPR